MNKEFREFTKRGEVFIDARYVDDFMELLDKRGCHFYMDSEPDGVLFVNDD